MGLVSGFVLGCSPIALDPWTPEQVWSVDTTRDQHHATVVALPAGAAVGFTDGWMSDPNHQAVVRWITSDGAPADTHLLLNGQQAAKPDLDLDAEGLLLAGFQGQEGITVERVRAAGATESAPVAPAEEALGNNSVDLAVGPRGDITAVWYDQAEVGTYRAATLGPDLAPADGLSGPFADTDDVSPSSPDVAIHADGDAVVAWGEQNADGDPDALWLDRYDPAGALRWRILLDTESDGRPPRRGTVVARPDGTTVIAWRVRRDVAPTPSDCRLAAVDAEGAWQVGATNLTDTDCDEVVLADGPEGLVWTAFVATGDATVGGGDIVGGFWSPEDGAWSGLPEILSSLGGLNSRPHTDLRVQEDGTLALAVSWEHAELGRATEVRGRVGRMTPP